MREALRDGSSIRLGTIKSGYGDIWYGFISGQLVIQYYMYEFSYSNIK